ncbi:MAG: hypothetical protein CL677_04190 [Bdellovibrionaceae bacterium]|nr:hypothetical protein [Pseudobdellovibrionaceae bacterium]|tara:strand:- start:26478 stop:27044 length:567 start_codon:yes stop_codon:yes gene_type:complete
MSISEIQLQNLPKPFKVMGLGYLFALSLAYAYALLNIALVVGLTPKDIMIHYYGSDKVIEVSEVQNEGEESFSFEEMDAEEAPIVVRPSLKSLVAEGHFHLFGMTSFFFGLCLLALFSSVSSTAKCWLVGLPFFTVVVDNLSFLATRFLGPKFAYLTAFAGMLMFISFSALWWVVFRDLIKNKEMTRV